MFISNNNYLKVANLQNASNVNPLTYNFYCCLYSHYVCTEADNVSNLSACKYMMCVYADTEGLDTVTDFLHITKDFSCSRLQ